MKYSDENCRPLLQLARRDRCFDFLNALTMGKKRYYTSSAGHPSGRYFSRSSHYSQLPDVHIYVVAGSGDEVDDMNIIEASVIDPLQFFTRCRWDCTISRYRPRRARC